MIEEKRRFDWGTSEVVTQALAGILVAVTVGTVAWGISLGTRVSLLELRAVQLDQQIAAQGTAMVQQHALIFTQLQEVRDDLLQIQRAKGTATIYAHKQQPTGAKK